MPQGDVPDGYATFPYAESWRFIGWDPTFIILPMPAPNGTVHTFFA